MPRGKKVDDSDKLPDDWQCKLCETDNDEPIVQCDECMQWYHQKCSSYTTEDADKVWLCLHCEKYETAMASENESQSTIIPQNNVNEEQSVSRSQILNHKELVTDGDVNSECGTNQTNKSNSSTIKLKLARLQELRKINEHFINEKYKLLESENIDVEISSQLLEKNPEVTHFNIPAVDNENLTSSKSKVENWIRKNNVTQGMENIRLVDLAKITADQISARNSIPRKLPLFSGNAKDWPLFYNSFKTSTEELALTNEQNLVRLREALKGEAYDLVEDDLIFAESVPMVIKTLKQIYGRTDVIISAILEKLRVLPVPNLNDMKTIIKYASVVRSLKVRICAGGADDHINNPMMFYEILQKLPPQLQLEWTRFKKQNNESANINALSKYLDSIAEEACEVAAIHDNQVNKNKNNYFQPTPRRIVRNMKTEVVEEVSESNENKIENDKCLICNKSKHLVTECNNFIQMSISKRWDIVYEKNLCKSCLKIHKGWKCKFPNKCGVNGCTRWHNKMLHKTKPESTLSNTTTTVETLNVNTHHVQQKIFFKIIPVKLYNDNIVINTYALLDDASSGTLIDEDVAKKLNLDGPNCNLHIKWTSNKSRFEENSKLVNILISGTNTNDSIFQIFGARTVSNQNLPVQSVSEEIKNQFKHLKDVPFECYQDGKPTILIGIDQANLIATREVIEGQYGQPIAEFTNLGWIVCGPNYGSKDIVCQLHENISNDDENLHEIVKKYFSSEEPVMKKKFMSKDDERAISIMEKTSNKVNNRYEIGLIWKNDCPDPPESYDMALKRLITFEKKLNSNENLKLNARNQIESYVKKGYAKKLSDEEVKQSKRSWYLPIFNVVNYNKPEKFRLVWDAAAKVDNVSLNDMLLKGPDYLKPMTSVLYAFREGKYAVTADISEMFHRILIKKEDRCFQRFLWRDGNSDRPPDHYQMNVMIFGAVCSPSSAQFILNKNAKNYENSHQRAVKGIVERHYVDNYTDSFKTESEAIIVSNQIKNIHAEGGFELRGWNSNSLKLLHDVGEIHNQKLQSMVVDTDLKIEKILGIWWNPKDDSFQYISNLNRFNQDIFNGKRRPTKREVLRVLMSIYDPIGLIAFFMIFLKILLQDIWRSGIDWDDTITDKQYECWNKWVSLLPLLPNVQIQRCYSYKLSNADPVIELHMFCDASQKAYAAVAYFRIYDINGIHISLIGAKTRVAPLKPTSIPRLELMAALLGTKFAEIIVKNHPFKVHKMFYWSDSTTVIQWLNADPMNYKQFVAIRIGQIQEKTSIKDWYWINSKNNIADEATKWNELPKINGDTRWFKGPPFLYLDKSQWPDQKYNHNTTIEEIKIHTSVINIANLHPHIIIDVNKYSKFVKLVRMQARIMRIKNNWLSKVRNCAKIEGTALLCTEIINAEKELFKCAQWKDYKDEILFLHQNPELNVHPNSKLHKLTPYVDEDGLLRIRGRIDAVPSITEYQKRPIILDRGNVITKLLVASYHIKYLHANNEVVINEIRQKFFISHLRQLLKSVCAQCQYCKNKKAKPIIPQMSPLPATRLAAFTRPFTYVGVDFFGPMTVAVGRRQEKRYGALFTCLVIRAVHVEIAYSLSTDSFIMCLNNFISLRGIPKEIRCDNGTNFHGSQNELEKAISKITPDEIKDKFMNIKFSFNPPSAPHMGGVWERLVQSIKRNLFQVLPVRTPNDELLRSCIMEVVNIVNSRPLTYIPIDPDTNEALTPNHFLLGSSSGAKPAGVFDDKVMMLNKKWQISQKVADHFWRRWIKEYAPTLCRRTKWFETTPGIQKGTIVVIVDENNTRNNWPLGIVEELIKSKDNNVRQVRVKTGEGLIYTRPVHKLAPLDVVKNN